MTLDGRSGHRLGIQRKMSDEPIAASGFKAEMITVSYVKDTREKCTLIEHQLTVRKGEEKVNFFGKILYSSSSSIQ